MWPEIACDTEQTSLKYGTDPWLIHNFFPTCLIADKIVGLVYYLMFQIKKEGTWNHFLIELLMGGHLSESEGVISWHVIKCHDISW